MENEQSLILTITDRSILKILYKNFYSPVSLYQLHKDYNYSLEQIVRFMSKLSEKGIVEDNNETIQITEYGRKWLLAYRNEIFFAKVAYDWLEVPTKMLKRSIPINTLYVPNQHEIGVHFFKDILGDRDK